MNRRREPACSHAVQVRILERVRAGETIGAACAASGIPTTTLYRAAAADELLSFHLRLARDDGAPFRAPLRHLAKLKSVRPTREERQQRAARAKRGWCADALCGTCLSCARRASALAWIAERGFKYGRHDSDWLPEEDALLRRMAGAHPTAAIARAVSAIGVPRTTHAVKMRAGRLDIGLYPTREQLSAHDIAILLGASERKVGRWLAGGAVPAVRGSALRTAEWSVQAADVERFLREQPWAYDPARLGRGRLADLGRVLHRADPWLASRAAARWLGIERTTLQYHIARGRLVAHRRTFGDARVLVIRRFDVATFARELDAIRARAASRGRDARGRLLALADAS